MPTGYTYPVVDGKITEFPDFALLCARAFGALIMMRDDPMDASIPDEFEPETKYYDDRLAADMKRLGGVQAMTMADANTAALEVHREALASRSKYLADKEIEAGRLNAMLAHVRAWNPPTPDHAEMKKFMIDQLVMSLPGDYAPAIPALLDGAAWRQQEIDRLADSIVYSQKEIAKEVERARTRTEWVKSLRASLIPSQQGNTP
ncbi:hypothetical protein SAMN05444159_1322 [Bradyrhizobium lablabi]|uniref:Uncharacterized protein n=1 Tax=Bradyrhizobium lablabi TaxID=722472 RepID=A0A1M6LME5_9BRAD|nr:hypothetical protein [Bradyrhizobium lablabi]SHJ72314.1 hypothetical protein SAMN05444159_1322 [Bradyrhizobium lablabi]